MKFDIGNFTKIFELFLTIAVHEDLNFCAVKLSNLFLWWTDADTLWTYKHKLAEKKENIVFQIVISLCRSNSATVERKWNSH